MLFISLFNVVLFCTECRTILKIAHKTRFFTKKYEKCGKVLKSCAIHKFDFQSIKHVKSCICTEVQFFYIK